MMQERLRFTVNPEDVTDDLIMRRCSDLRHAVRLCRDCSPLSDDEILHAIKKKTGRVIHKSHFSEALNGGDRNFPPELIQTLEDVCSNLIPTRFMALSRNFELRPKKEALELENEHLRDELEREREKNRIIAEFMKEIRNG